MNYLSRNDVKKISARAQKVLDELGDELGLVVTYAGSRFNSKNATLKFTFSTINQDGDAQSPEIVAFKQYAYMYGLEASDLGRKFVTSTGYWTIVGLQPRARQYPIVAEQNGKRKRYGAKYVKATMVKKEAA